MKTIVLRLLENVVELGIAYLILYKVFLANDIKTSFKQDPMENWIALGIGCLILKTVKNDVFQQK